MVRRHGRVCQAGFLGGLSPLESFNPLLQVPSGVHFSFFGSFVFGTPEFPLSEIPFQEILDRAANGVYQAQPARNFMYDKIGAAHLLVESSQEDGYIVAEVTMGRGL